MRRNRSQTAKRRSHHALARTRVATCECGASRLPHRACPQCGKYRGRVVIDVVAVHERQARRAKRKQKEIGAIAETEKETDTEKSTA